MPNQISAPMVEPGNAKRVALENVPILTALLPQLEKAHAAVMAVATPPADPRVRQLMAREETLDGEPEGLTHVKKTYRGAGRARRPHPLMVEAHLLPRSHPAEAQRRAEAAHPSPAFRLGRLRP
jgi:hypothetical protein